MEETGNNGWIREKLVNPKQFVSEISLKVKQGTIQTIEIQPNFYFKNKYQQILGWISDDESDDQLFVGVTDKESWIFAICDDS